MTASPQRHQDADQPAAEAGLFGCSRDDGKPGREGIGCVLVEPGVKGFAVTGTYHTMGGENLHEVQFTNCELPLENLVIREDGFRKLLTAFNTQRCLNPSISLGLAEGAFDETVSYVRDRQLFGKSLSESQGVRWKLADMYKDIEAAAGCLPRLVARPFPDPFLPPPPRFLQRCRSASPAMRCSPRQLRLTEYLVSALSRRALRLLVAAPPETLRFVGRYRH